MLQDLLLIDHRAGALPRTRHLLFPDGRQVAVTAPAVVWRWLDHLGRCPSYPGHDVLLDDVAAHAARTGQSHGDALGHMVGVYVHTLEQAGRDVTDDDIDNIIAAKAMAARLMRR